MPEDRLQEELNIIKEWIHVLDELFLFEEDGEINEYIKSSGDKWLVLSKNGKVLGTHDSKTDAQAQFDAIHANQNH